MSQPWESAQPVDAARAAALGVRVEVSLTHTRAMAGAVAVLAR